MNKVAVIEQYLGLKFPDDYSEFLLKADTCVVENNVYCRVLQDNYRTDGVVYEFYTTTNFIKQLKNRDRNYLLEFQIHFENSTDYVEAEYLYHIAEGTGSICISLGGQHYGKIYSVDNGDFGIIYQADNINQFIDSLYNPEKFGCQYQDLIEAVSYNNLERLIELVEKKDGNRLIQYSSFLDIELFDTAYTNNFDNILRYLISKGYRGYNRVELYKLEY